MAQFDEHKVKDRLQASRRAKPRFRDSDTFLTILMVVVGFLALMSLGFMLLVIFL